jgi:exonuclease VII small subunit
MAEKQSYKQLETELHEVLDRVESSSYDDLDSLIADYNSGMKLINELEAKLKTAKNSIKKTII